MFDRVAIYGVPLLAGVVTALVLLGPGGERPALGVKVRGMVAEDTDRVALRVQALSFAAGNYAERSIDHVSIALSTSDAIDAPTIGSWQGSVDGHQDVLLTLSERAHGQLHLRVSTTAGMLLSAPLVVAPRLPHEEPRPLAESASAPALRMAMWRGGALYEQPEPLSLYARSAGPDVSLVPALTGCVIASGLDVVDSRCGDDGCEHRWRGAVTCRDPGAQLAFVLEADGAKSRVEATFSPQPGVLWIDPDQHDGLHVRSAVEVERVWLSLYSDRGRVGGAREEMTKADDGYRGFIALDRIEHDGPLVAVVSTDPLEDAGATSAWPLREGEGSVRGELSLLGDGMPQAIAAEDARRTRARLPAFALVIAAALFELLYLWLRWQRSRRQLRALADQLDDVAVNALDVRPPVWWLTLLVGGLVISFAILAIITLLA